MIYVEIFLEKRRIGYMEETNLLGCLVYWLPYIQELIGTNCALALSDREKFLGFLEGTEIQLGIKTGDLIKKGSVSEMTIKEIPGRYWS